MTVEKKSRALWLPLAVALLLPARVRLSLNIFRRSGDMAIWHKNYGG